MATIDARTIVAAGDEPFNTITAAVAGLASPAACRWDGTIPRCQYSARQWRITLGRG